MPWILTWNFSMNFEILDGGKTPSRSLSNFLISLNIASKLLSLTPFRASLTPESTSEASIDLFKGGKIGYFESSKDLTVKVSLKDSFLALWKPGCGGTDADDWFLDRLEGTEAALGAWKHNTNLKQTGLSATGLLTTSL